MRDYLIGESVEVRVGSCWMPGVIRDIATWGDGSPAAHRVEWTPNVANGKPQLRTVFKSELRSLIEATS